MTEPSLRDPAYETARRFRDLCMAQGRSLLWPSSYAWTPANIDRLWQAFVVTEDTSSDSFLTKWHGQLADLDPNIHRIAADALVMYWLFPSESTARAETKADRVHEVISWKLGAEEPPRHDIIALFGRGVGGVGTHYLTAQPLVIAYLLALVSSVRKGEADPTDAESFQALADRLATEVKGTPEARHVLLHLLFSDRYERIASQRHKEMIVQAFADHTNQEPDIDRALALIRAQLAPQYRDSVGFDFYRPEVQAQWNPTAHLETRTGWWVEKTNVKDRPDRTEGEFALGRVLWSPQRAATGGDIYRFMRDVRPEDIVLHLTDNEGFSGLSRAASSFSEFNGVEGTTWGAQPSYRIELRDYIRLEPPLSRSTFMEGDQGNCQ